MVFSCSACGGAAGRPPVVPARDEDPSAPSATIPIDPHPGAPPVCERHDGAATLEIVPLHAIEHRQKFGVVQPIDLAAHAADAFDQSGVLTEIEQAAAHPAFSDEP